MLPFNKKHMETFSYLIVNIRLNFVDYLLPIFFLNERPGCNWRAATSSPSSVYIRWHIIYGLWHDELGRPQPLKAAVLKGDVTDLKCSLAFDQDQEIIKINNLGKQDLFIFLTGVLSSRAGIVQRTVVLHCGQQMTQWYLMVSHWCQKNVLFTLII